MSGRYKAVATKKGNGKARNIPVWMFLNCVVNTVAEDVQALLAGEPSFLGNFGEKVGEWIDNLPC